ncbi:uncharacterized protein [Drosophila pseudoobscura]|nr:uncharacterized protein LOC117184640 isoform X2 [Drosophila pseudoobscura]
MGNGMRGLCGSSAEVEAWELDAAGASGSILKMDRVGAAEEGHSRGTNKGLSRAQNSPFLGAQFAGRAFKRFLEQLGVRHQFTAPYTPQENPTERTNRTIETMIAQFTEDDQICWDEKWPELMLAMNSGVSDTTGYSPAFVVQGREPRLPKALYDEETVGTGQGTETPDENAKKLKELFQLVRRNLKRAAQDQARHYNLRRRPWRPKVGEGERKIKREEKKLSKPEQETRPQSWEANPGSGRVISGSG